MNGADTVLTLWSLFGLALAAYALWLKRNSDKLDRRIEGRDAETGAGRTHPAE